MNIRDYNKIIIEGSGGSGLEQNMKSHKIYDSIEKFEPITKGWSEDKKYRVTTADGIKYLLRVTPISRYETRKALFEMLERVAALDIPMCVPIEFGTCGDRAGRSKCEPLRGSHSSLPAHASGVYSIQSWIGGEDLKTVLPGLSETEQYILGFKSGEILRKMHTVPAPETQEEWDFRYNRKTNMKVRQYQECGLRFDGDGYVIEYIEQNRRLLKNRPQCF